MTNLTRGQKVKLADIGGGQQLRVGLGAVGPGLSFDISCFGVDANGKLSDDRYFIFFNQHASPEGALKLSGTSGEDTQSFEIDLARLPSAIVRLVFAITIDGAGEMKQLQSGHFRLLSGASEVARFSFAGSDFSGEKAIIAAEVYLKDVWRVAAVGQGFNGGLGALLKNYGGEEAGTPTSAAPTPVVQAPPSAAPVPPVAAPPPAAPTQGPPMGQPPANDPFGFGSTAPPSAPQGYPPQNAPYGAPTPQGTAGSRPGAVTLEKRGEKSAVDLRKGGGTQPIHINLNWDNPNAGKKGLLAAFSSAPDLDLGCMFRLKTGEAGVIQSLGNSFGARDRPPFIYLDKDDRSGAATDGENLLILRPDLVDLVLIFAFVYTGASDFSSVGGRMSVRDQNGGEIFMRLSTPERGRNFCGIASIRNIGASIEITKEELYFRDHREADQRFGFGFRWAAGSK